MSITRLQKTLGIICILVILSALTSVSEARSQYNSSASGSFFSSVIDSNGDGIPGVIGMLQGQSNFGSVTIHFFSEFDVLAAAQSENCPTDYLEVPVVTSRTIHSHRNSDLLYFTTTSEIFCGNLTTGEFIWRETLAVIGGTGKFADASGTMEVTGSGVLLISDPMGATNFGGVSLSGKGRIKLNGN